MGNQKAKISQIPATKTGYIVAPRRSVTTATGIISTGQPVDPDKFDITSLLRKKAIVKR